MFCAYSLPLFQVLWRVEYHHLRGCACDEVHTQSRAAGKSRSEIPRRRSRGLCAGGKCSAAVAERSRQQPTDGSGEQQQHRFARESARAYKLSCAVHRQFRLARRHFAVTFLHVLTCYKQQHSYIDLPIFSTFLSLFFFTYNIIT